jgi:hypothetical protein
VGGREGTGGFADGVAAQAWAVGEVIGMSVRAAKLQETARMVGGEGRDGEIWSSMLGLTLASRRRHSQSVIRLC